MTKIQNQHFLWNNIDFFWSHRIIKLFGKTHTHTRFSRQKLRKKGRQGSIYRRISSHQNIYTVFVSLHTRWCLAILDLFCPPPGLQCSGTHVSTCLWNPSLNAVIQFIAHVIALGDPWPSLGWSQLGSWGCALFVQSLVTKLLMSLLSLVDRR